MKSPFTGKDMTVVREWRTLSFRKEEFAVCVHTYLCEDTGEKFEDEQLAELNYNQLINQYRIKYSIPFPEQILAIREQYGLSAAKMADVLGFGTNVYRQYENGEVPNQSNAKLIQLANDPHEFKKLISLYPSHDEKFAEKMGRIIENLLENQKNDKLEKQLEHYFLGMTNPNNFTGFKTPSIHKLSEMVVFFTEKLQPWKTKLNKLLFYSDFLMFSQAGVSISGIPYRAIPMGPVPNNFNSLFEYLTNKGEFNVNYINFNDGGTGEQFTPHPKRQFNKELFSELELNVMNAVANRFKNTTTSEIIEISHQEKAWIDNQAEHKLIDYNLGFELKTQQFTLSQPMPL